MTEHVSIWRWVVETDLEDWFAQLVAADDAQFAQLGQRMAQEGDAQTPSLEQLAEETRAKFSGMNLPPDVLQTMLDGLETMLEEAREEEASWDEEDDAQPMPGQEGRVDVALASSHMFFDDPYASIDHEDIDAQVAAVIEACKAATTKAVGHPGQSLAQALGKTQEQLWEDDTFDVLMAAGVEAVQWVWETPLGVCYIGQWQEDKELPIDLVFGRLPASALEAVRKQI